MYITSEYRDAVPRSCAHLDDVCVSVAAAVKCLTVSTVSFRLRTCFVVSVAGLAPELYPTHRAHLRHASLGDFHGELDDRHFVCLALHFAKPDLIAGFFAAADAPRGHRRRLMREEK